jgi:hypothetical protein
MPLAGGEPVIPATLEAVALDGDLEDCAAEAGDLALALDRHAVVGVGRRTEEVAALRDAPCARGGNHQDLCDRRMRVQKAGW